MAKLGRMKNINPVFSTDDDDFFAVGFFLLLVMLALTCACFKHIDNKEAAHEITRVNRLMRIHRHSAALGSANRCCVSS